MTGEASGADGPAILWRLTRGRSTAHALVIGAVPPVTITWFIDGQMDRAENYDSLDLALARSDYIRSVLMTDGWTDRTSPAQDEQPG